MDKKDVFISYKSEEYEEALWVKNTLENNGISCWMAPMCIPGGSNYAVEIPAAINNCRVFVLILSERSQMSQWVPKELDRAINTGKVIMPFMLENCRLQDDFNFYLTNVQRYEAYKSKVQTIERMIREINGVLGRPAMQPEEKPVTEAPVVEAPVVEEPAVEAPVVEAPVVEEPAVTKSLVEEPVAEKTEIKKTAPQKPVAKKPAAGKPEKKKEASAKGKKNPLKIVGIVAAAVAVLILLSVVLVKAGEVTIADTVFRQSDSSVTLTGKTLTADDLKAFEKFEDLYSITLTDCKIKSQDLSALTSGSLGILRLSNCGLMQNQLVSLNLAEQTKLRELDISGNAAIIDLEPILNLAEVLTELHLSDTGISDLSALAAFTNLRVLTLRNLNLENVDFAESMIYLEKVDISANAVINLRGLKNATQLQFFAADNNKLFTLSELAGTVDKLEELYICGNYLSDVESTVAILSACTNLRVLHADDNTFRTLSWLSCTNLRELSMQNNAIKSLEGLSICEKLTTLNLSGNRLKYVKGGELKFENVYVKLDLSNNWLESVELPTETSFSLLSIEGNRLPDLDFLKSVKGNTVIFDYPEDYDGSQLSLNFGRVYVVDCPLDQRVAVEKACYGAKFVAADEAKNLPEKSKEKS